MNRTTASMKVDCDKCEFQHNDLDRESYDVFFARGHKFDSYPGNKLYRRVVRLYSHLYKESTDLRVKKAFVDNVIDFIHSKQGRFFHQTKTDKNITYQELDSCGNKLRDKIRQSLRDAGEKVNLDKEGDEALKLKLVQIDHENKRFKPKQLDNIIKGNSDTCGFGIKQEKQDCHFSYVNSNHADNMNNCNSIEDEFIMERTQYQDVALNSSGPNIPRIVTAHTSSILDEYLIQHHLQLQQLGYQFHINQRRVTSSDSHILEADNIDLPLITSDTRGHQKQRIFVNKMYNLQQDDNAKVQQIHHSNQSFIETIRNKQTYDCARKDGHHSHHSENASNHQQINQIIEEVRYSNLSKNIVSEKICQMEVDEEYVNKTQNYIQDTKNDEEGFNQQPIMSLLASSTSACTDLRMTNSHIPPLARSQNGNLVDYHEELPGKQFQPIYNIMNETEHHAPEEPELQPQPKLLLEPMSKSIQRNDKVLTNSDLDEIIKSPLFSPDPSISSSLDWSIEGDLDMSW